MTEPTFTQRPDGSITVDGWPQATRMSSELLDEISAGKNPIARLESGTHTSDFVVFTVANGSARYRVLGRSGGWHDLELRESTLNESILWHDDEVQA